MQYLSTYLKTIANRGNVLLADSIARTADDVGENILKDFHFVTMK